MDYDIGIQSAVYRETDVQGLIEKLQELGVSTIELADDHLSHGDDEGRKRRLIAALEDAGIDVCGYGVVFFDEEDDAREVVRFARRLGAEYVSFNLHSHDREMVRELVAVANDADVALAIHNIANHDDGVAFSTVSDLESAVTDGSAPGLRICLDTGHVLAGNERLEDAFRRVGDHVDTVHLKGGGDGENRLSLTDEEDLREVIDLFDKFAHGDRILVEHRSETGDMTGELNRIIGSIADIAR